MRIIAGIETFRETGEGRRGDGSMATITSLQWPDLYLYFRQYVNILPFREITLRAATACFASFSQPWPGKRRSLFQNAAKGVILSPKKSYRRSNLA
jgi:hypothetical protein